MKLVRQGNDFIILSDADVAIQVIKESEVINGDEIVEAQLARNKYAAHVKKMSNEKLLELFATSFYMVAFGLDTHKDHNLMGEAICEEILNRMDNNAAI